MVLPEQSRPITLARTQRTMTTIKTAIKGPMVELPEEETEEECCGTSVAGGGCQYNGIDAIVDRRRRDTKVNGQKKDLKFAFLNKKR